MHSYRISGQFIFWTITQFVMISLVIGILPALAQNTTPAHKAVPATARQAATMPEFASHLALCPATQAAQRATRKHPASSCSMVANSPLDNQILYENGPVNGQVDAWTVNFGYAVTDSMQVNGPVLGVNFWTWLIPGDNITNIQVSIGSSPFGADLFNGFVNLGQTNCFGNSFGYNVCMQSGAITVGPTLNGSAWITLQNANVPSGDPVYWDENSGAGCTSNGCPSQAQENSIGTIPSEAFSVLGFVSTTTTTTTTYPQNYCVPEQSGAFKVIHDFTGNGDGDRPSGVAMDRAGNLYGATQGGGSSGAGTVYKLAQTASSWVLNTLYSFLGGSSGNSAQGVIVGPHDNLYGSALGGIQNGCGNDGYCGFIFQLRPAPTACPAISCGWTETLPYSFTGSTDAWNGNNLVSDQAGNLYGVSQFGGAQGYGAIFELTPTLGGWTESILYSFTNTSDGEWPATLIVGNDGNLYGTTGWGGAYYEGTIFQLTPFPSGWNLVVLYNFSSAYGGASNPHSLQQDSAGNLFGIYGVTGGEWNYHSVVFELSPSNGNWVFTQLFEGSVNWDGRDLFPNMILDAAGNLLVTEYATPACPSGYDYADIFELQRANGWQSSFLVGWDNTYWSPQGNLALDSQGNLYGAEAYCGLDSQGMVWELASAP